VAAEAHDPNVPVSRDLEVMGAATQYYDWILAELRPFLGRRVLETGSGHGNLTKRLFDLGLDRVAATDFDERFLVELRALCEGRENADVLRLDLQNPSAEALEYVRTSRIDSVIMVNVLEHIDDDGRCLDQLGRALLPGGRILVFGPAFQMLYAPLDRIYGHFRRYHKRDMRALATRAGLRLRETHYVNLPGFFAWFVLYKLRRARGLDSTSVSVFNAMIPVIRRLESRFRPPIGLSIFAVFEKPLEDPGTRR
jgi:SAM-dependent methyltransferase